MQKPKPPPNEAARIESLRSYAVLDTLPEANYDDIVELAARICGVPIALVSLVDDERQWFKARHGLEAAETPRDISFCGHAVETGALLVVPDATLDERFADNPLVTGGPNVRFYAGAPLRNEAGFDLGTLCVIDQQPRVLETEQLDQLQALSRLVVALLEQRIETQERQAAERALALALDDAQSANRAKSAFLTSMSHELRTPLNSVIGFTNLLAKNKRNSLNADELMYLERINANGRHLLSLINDVLDISRIEGAQLDLSEDHIDLAELVTEVIGELGGAISEAGNNAISELPNEVGLVAGDRKRLKQVLINLVGNANKFMESGLVAVRVVSEKGIAQRLEVADGGPGIALADRERIFAAFGQAQTGHSRPYGGTGLGLSISKALCDAMGFKLGLTSEVGQGSTFFVDFEAGLSVPTHQRPTQAAAKVVFAKRARPESEPLQAHGTVLIIDDDSDARLLLVKLVEETGANVITADNAARGLQIARALKPDLIVLDLCMPGMSGQDALVRINRDDDLRSIPIIICSSLGRPSDLDRSLAVLAKPLDRRAFRNQLRAHLGSVGDVLIVEDDEDARLLLESVVDELGIHSRSAKNGLLALAEVERSLPSLILLDLCMPEMNGFEFLTRLGKLPGGKDVRVLVCSAIEPTAEQSEFLRMSTDAVLQKGEELVDKLLVKMREQLSRLETT